ncbi:hypothetical protein TRFO_09102 [Tritrichomonas foetus]|uniref:HECT-type E3 ubiquitin transferase n=1 Tax=Tritrichomonas foetus TaxID=1144522 RepID=A0A1J4JI62_9EUKA|nr:hypothetical protein TRFO_09102 [Tritrichomonas foetus]|eukprot:OHS97967.1 hypothetical protein TRFO_09102 [Tritrichomonas foetus]
MTWEDSELQNRFSTDSYNTILELFQVDDIDTQIVALQTLSETLAYGDDNLLSNFPLCKMSRSMVEFLGSEVELIQETAAFCIFQFLEAHTSSARYLVDNGALQAIEKTLVNCTSVRVAEHLIRCCQVISKYRPSEIGQYVGLRPLLCKFDFFRINEQRMIAQTLSQITSECFYNNFVDSIDDILALLCIDDQQITKNLLNSAVNIAKGVSPENLKPETIKNLISIIPSITEKNQILQIAKFLLNASQNPIAGEAIINSNIDFRILINRNDSNEIVNIAYKTILNLLPEPKMPCVNSMWATGRKPPNNSLDFALKIQPVLFKTLTESFEIEPLAIVALSVSIRLTKSPLTKEIIHAMCGFAQQDRLLPFVLCMVLSFSDREQFASNGLLQILKSKLPLSNSYEAYCNWYNQKVNQIAKGKDWSKFHLGFNYSKYKTLIPLLNRLKTVSCFEFLNENFLEHITNMIDSCHSRTLEKIDFTSFIEKLIEVLHFLPIDKMTDPFKPSVYDIANQGTSISLNYIRNPAHNHKSDDENDEGEESEEKNNEATNSYRLGNRNLVLGAEGLYNKDIRDFSYNNINQGWKDSGKLGKIIKPPSDLDELTYTEFALYNRAFNSPNYKKCSFVLENKKVSGFDPFLRANELAQQVKDKYNRLTLKLRELKGNEEDNFVLSKLEIPTDRIDPKMIKILEFINFLCKKIPNKRFDKEFSNFESRIKSLLVSPFLISTCQSAAVQIVANYPCLFSYSLKSFVFKTMTLSFVASMNSFSQFVHNEKYEDHRTHVKVLLNRDDIFNDGCILLKSFGHPFIHFDVTFENEEGIGIGPGQEFYTLMGKEFAKVERNMWINDSIDSEITENLKEGEKYANSRCGLYPKVGADPKKFEMLGVLCGKAIEMNYIVPIPISEAFFKIMKGENVELEEIDEQLARSLKQSDHV